MRWLLAVLCSPLIVSATCWVTLASCIDAPVETSASAESIARLVVAWDPLACGDPHRIAIELEDDAGVPLAASAPCNLGGLTVDVAHFGIFRGRIYAWELGAPIRSISPLDLTIHEPIVHWHVPTPP